ncbi:hypothetical protein HGRIS_000978 [Hohenbuehelia grisea]|uniref:tRNA(His) guanylyltransferase n=1 Tax=Hohenbuehelia grisea TaxID=104357 RepID=A0ABR3IQC6_9AGAR
MANSKFAYVRNFELPDPLLPGTSMVFRLDGHSFHRFSEEHKFSKPNDVRALQLMDCAARTIMEEYKDIVLGFGESDEFSFLLRKSTSLYNRRQSKICSTLTSLFTSAYVFHWKTFFPDTSLQYPPSFDGRIVLYPSQREIRDYFSWRQADTHINNLYNTVFWALVLQGGQTTTEAHATLRGTVSAQKHEILFKRYGINYNELDPRFRKGSVIVRELVDEPAPSETILAQPINNGTSQEPTGLPEQANVASPGSLVASNAEKPRPGKKTKTKSRTRIEILHCDIIADDFWTPRPHLLED